MADVKITALKNGPYKVEGTIALACDDVAVPADARVVYLCRCGASANKPFCDGAHSKIGFQAVAPQPRTD